MKKVDYTLRLRAEQDDNGCVRYVIWCLTCMKTFGPRGEDPDDHEQVIWDISIHECDRK